jgi:hypothetical protein
MDMYSINKNLVGYQAAKIKIKIKRSQPSAAPTGTISTR